MDSLSSLPHTGPANVYLIDPSPGVDDTNCWPCNKQLHRTRDGACVLHHCYPRFCEEDHNTARSLLFGGRLCYDMKYTVAARSILFGGRLCYDRKNSVAQSTQWPFTGTLAGRSYGNKPDQLMTDGKITLCNQDRSKGCPGKILCAITKTDKEYSRHRHVIFVISYNAMMYGANISLICLMRIKLITMPRAVYSAHGERLSFVTLAGGWGFQVTVNYWTSTFG